MDDIHADLTSKTPSTIVLIASASAPTYTSPIIPFGFCALGEVTDRKKPIGIKIAAHGAPSRATIPMAFDKLNESTNI